MAMLRTTRLVLAALFALVLVAPVAHAQSALDAMGLTPSIVGHAKVELTVTAGPSGAPSGFEVCWMTAAEFASYGNTWPAPWVSGEGWDDFTGVGTLNTFGSTTVNFQLAPNQSVKVEVGDTYDETGVTGTAGSELSDGTSFVFCAYAIASGGSSAGPLSVTVDEATSIQGTNCTYTLGYWKNHTGAWPVSSLTLGTVSYSASQLLQILNQPTGGNGLVSLAHQLIAAKLNIANGADGSAVASTITNADALIGALVVPPIGSDRLAPSVTSADEQALDDFNNGVTGPGHCGTVPTHDSTWGRLKTLYH